MNQHDIDELTEVFVEESQEIVENLNKDVLVLEKSLDDPAFNKEILNNIFRYVHTLKGNSGLAGADKLRDLAHKMESLLDRLRKEKLVFSPVIVDLLFEGIDRIDSILQEVISGTDQGVSIEELVQKLEKVLNGETLVESSLAAEPSKPARAQTRTAAPSSSVSAFDDKALAAIPEDIARILTEYEENRLQTSLSQHLSVYELLLNLVMEGFEQIVAAIIDHLNTIGEVIAKVPSSKAIPHYDLQVRIIFTTASSEAALRQQLDAHPLLKQQNFSVDRILHQQTEPASSFFESAPPDLTLSSPEAKPAVSPQAPAQVHAPPSKAVAAKPSPPKELLDQSGGNTVRVDIKKLDNLMNIVGELVLAKARYIQIESELEASNKYKTLHDHLKKNNQSNSKKLEDLREAILQVRMVQVGSLFNRFPRIVRDLAKTHNKRIDLILEGEETELDKAVVDEMGEPLIHLIRNAVDHGVEDLETRKSFGKPDIGTITLRAYQEGSYIVIEIQDDGAGINVNRIREKAIEAGLIEKGSKLSENDILNFIFHPGFSTAQKVTNTSGRGVGMDVVKLAISRLKGIIDIQTSLHVGTKFIVKLPLTLAIIQVLLIRVASHIYAIPLSSVTESFKLNLQKIEVIDGQEVTQLRTQVLPLLRLKKAFGLTTSDTPKTPERGFVVVIGLAEKKIGLVVDELLEQQEIVIKPLGRYLLRTPGFAGATTLGNGRVVLILDVVSLIESLNAKKLEKTHRKEQPAIVA